MTKEQIEALGITYVEGMSDDAVFAEIQKISKSKDDKVAELQGTVSKHKSQIDKYSSEIAEFKRKEIDKLSEDEKKEIRLKELEDELAKSKRSVAERDKIETYMGIGYSKELAKKVATAELEGKDASVYHQEFIKSHDEALKAELMKNNPAPKGGAGKTGDETVEEKFKNGTLSMAEMNELKEKNPSLYKKLIG